MVRLNYRGRVVCHAGDADLAPGLRLHLAGLHRARQLEETVRERRLPVIDVRDDRKIADALRIHET